MTKTKPGTFLGDVIIMMNKDVYIMDECRENNRCADVKAYKSSQLTNLQFKPMQNSPVHTSVQVTNLSYVSYQQTLIKQQILYRQTAHSLSKVV